MAYPHETYEWSDTDPNGHPVPSRKQLPIPESSADEGYFKMKLMNCLSYIVAKTVAGPLMYPGSRYNSLRTVESVIRYIGLHIPPTLIPALEPGLARLVFDNHGQRFRLKTRTGTIIDTMFVDQRNTGKLSNRDILVISCEGNCGFYEDGISQVPLKADYSVLMWNHPGFGDSTGQPWPDEEAAAIDVVVQYAIFRQGWKEEDIVIYAWSIGGFTASWAAMNYPNIRGLILDAAFDHILPVAMKFTPDILHSLLARTVRMYWNINIVQQVLQYSGPVLLIRRSKDYMTSSDPKRMRATNRLNWLLKDMLKNRYPILFSDEVVDDILDEFLAKDAIGRAFLIDSYGIDAAEWCRVCLSEYVYDVHVLRVLDQMEEGDEEEETMVTIFPMMIGSEFDKPSRVQLALFLITKYFKEVEGSHYVYLEPKELRVPMHPWDEEMNDT